MVLIVDDIIYQLVNYYRFPSPCGDYGSYHDSTFFDEDFDEVVSVPLRGLWFLSAKTRLENAKVKLESFRPLAGIMVLIRTLYKCLYEAVEMAFCGADHIFSSFFVFCRKMIFKKLLRTEF